MRERNPKSSATSAWLSAILLSFICSTSASGQIVPFDGIAMQTAMNTMNNSVREQNSGTIQIARPKRPVISTISVKPNPAVLTFASSPIRTRANLQAIVERSRTTNPGAAPQLSRFFQSTDILGMAGKGMSSVGLSRYNIADVFSAYWITTWEVANGIFETTASQKLNAVVNQARREMSGSPDILRLSDSQKQELAENLIIQAAMIEAMAKQARGNLNELKSLGLLVRQLTKARGLDLDAMTLTEKGFVPAAAPAYRRR